MQHIDWLACRYVAIDVEGTASPAGYTEQLVEVAAVEFLLAGGTGRMLSSSGSADRSRAAGIGWLQG